MASLDFSLAPSELQKYIIKHPELLSEHFTDGWKFMDYFATESGIEDRILLNRMEILSIGQPGGKDTFDPTEGAVKPNPRYGVVEECKVDLKFLKSDQDKLWKSYLAEMERRVKNGVYDDLPYQAGILQLIVKKFKEDVHKKALFLGVRNNAGTTPATMFNGINKQVDLAVISGEVPSGNVFTGTIPTISIAVAQVDGVKNLVPEDMWYEDLVCVMSPKVKELYDKNYIAVNGAMSFDPKLLTEGKQTIDRTNIEIIPEIGLAGSNRIMITPRNNFMLLSRGEGDIDNFTFEYAERVFKIMMDCKLGASFEWGKYIWTNDLA